MWIFAGVPREGHQLSNECNAAVNFNTYQNLQPHRVLLPAIARHLVNTLVTMTMTLDVENSKNQCIIFYM